MAKAYERSKRVYDIRKHLAHINQEHRKESNQVDNGVSKIQVDHFKDKEYFKTLQYSLGVDI